MEYLIFVNPMSKIYKKGKLKIIEDFFKIREIPFKIYISEYAGHMPELVEKTIKLLPEAEQITLIAVGGDGTLNEVVQGVLKSDKIPPIGFIPSGTANVLSKEFKIPSNIERALEIILRKERIIKFNLSMANRKIFLFTCGIGFDGYIVSNVNLNLKKLLGPASYILAGIKSLMHRKNFTYFQLYIDNEKFTCLTAIINRTQRYAANLRIFKNININDNFFEVLVVKKISFCSLFAIFFYILFNKKISKNFCFIKGKEIVITSSQSIPTQIDGDPLTFTPETISISPHYINIIGT